MRKTLIALALAACSLAAWAACTTHTITMPNGTMRVCTTCCDASGRNCNTWCT